jgi:hypothetical protein
MAGAVLSPAPAASGSGTVYHGDLIGDGAAPPMSAVDTATTAWMSPSLDGQIYGEPLIYAGRVYVATENNSVYALSASTGAVAWSAHLVLRCPPDRSPAATLRRRSASLVRGSSTSRAARSSWWPTNSRREPAHRLVGLSTGSGNIAMSQDVDPPGADAAALLQRTGLTLNAGQVVFGFGGNYGDWASYQAEWRQSRKWAERRSISSSTPRRVSQRDLSGWAAPRR